MLSRLLKSVLSELNLKISFGRKRKTKFIVEQNKKSENKFFHVGDITVPQQQHLHVCPMVLTSCVTKMLGEGGFQPPFLIPWWG